MLDQVCLSRSPSSMLTKAALVLTGMAASASAHVISFENMPDGFLSSYSEGAATIRAYDFVTSITADEFGLGPNGTRGVRANFAANGEAPFLRADFSSLMESVTVDISHVASSQIESAFLVAFDSNGRRLGTAGVIFIPDIASTFSLNVRAPGIAFVHFGSRTGSGNSSTVFCDNLAYSVPAPGAASILSLFAFVTLRRHRG